jgi:hypothetical protein
MAAQNPNNFNMNQIQNNQNINANMNQNWNANMNPFMYPYMNPNMMSPEQVQMMMRMQQQQFEMQKMQAFQIGQLLRKQKELVQRMKQNEERRQNEDLEIILFFNHNYEILPLTFKQSSFVSEALLTYIQQSNKQNVKFKFGGQELKLDQSGKTLKEVEGLVNGSEIIVQSQ